MVSARPAVALTGAVLFIAVLLSGSGGGAAALTTFGKALPACPPEKFDCQNGKCISGSRWCDGIDNCGNNADELSCRICLSGSLKCKGSNQCVPSGARCNGQIECQDKSDELGCETVVTVH
ncbi:hypothetical protein FOCC_FOCC003521 [Frankliniella occidentalis]|nr:hypothetical protein FOCC_FOCC003521 [Frankliniella occidentalis]